MRPRNHGGFFVTSPQQIDFLRGRLKKSLSPTRGGLHEGRRYPEIDHGFIFCVWVFVMF